MTLQTIYYLFLAFVSGFVLCGLLFLMGEDPKE